MGIRNWLKFWWVKVPHPRIFSVLFAGVYAVSVLTGLFTLFLPPQTLLGFAGDITVVITGLLFTGCGAIAAYAGTVQSWKLERIAIWGIMLGVFSYLVTVIHYATSNNANWYTLMGIFVFAFLLFIVRLAMIWRYSFNPRG